MKRLIYFLMLLGLVIGCTKDSIFDEYGFYGHGYAKLNGKDWNGKTGVFPKKFFCGPTDSCVAIKMHYLNEHGALRGDLTFDFVPLTTGKFTLNYVWPTYEDIRYKIIYSKYISDGDVITGGYHVFEQNDENYIEITGLNLEKGDISGSFQAVVVRDSFWVPQGYLPDTIRITEGSFYGKIYPR